MPHPTSTLQLRSITTCVQITRNVNMPHPTPTLQLRSITTCVLLTRNINMPYPTTTPPQPFSCVALQHVCYLQGTLTCPTPPHFKNDNPRGGGKSAAHPKELFSRDSVACGCSQENSVEKSSSRQENTMALKDELVPKPRQKSA